MATPIYNPLEPTEEIQPKPESITPQEKSEPEQPAPTLRKIKTTVPSEEKAFTQEKDKPVEKPAMSKEKETNKRNNGSSLTSE